VRCCGPATARGDLTRMRPRLLVVLAAAPALLAASCGDAAPASATRTGSSATVAAPGPALYRDVARERGIDFRHEVRAEGAYRIPEVLGSGCAAFDADGDGRLDLYFVNAGNGPGDGAPNRLYLQREGGRFEDATDRSGLGDRGFGTGVAVADVDRDGDLDVYVGNWGEDALYVNDGGVFTRHAADVGLTGRNAGLTTSAAFLDYDLDGHLDLYVAQYVIPLDLASCDGRAAISDYCAPMWYPPVADALYRNRGDGTFEDVSERAGIAALAAPGLAVTAEDFDGDGWTDVYVANDGVGNHLWLNRRDGTFRESATELGLAYNGLGAAEGTMGIASGDVDGDGHQDLVVTSLPGETSTVYRRAAGGTYEDATGRTGIGVASAPYTGWGIALFDVDLDGDLDLGIVNGKVGRRRRDPTERRPTVWAEYEEPSQLLRNRGNGAFDVTDPAAAVFGARPSVGRALLPADLDADGDVDLVVTVVAGPAQVFENIAPRAGRWLRVRCVDPALRRATYGARVEVRAGARTWSRSIAPATSYLASTEAVAHFGLGDVAAVDSVDVVWPGGERERFAAPALDAEVLLQRGQGTR
jgi:enediyne biosynthesis protein E4